MAIIRTFNGAALYKPGVYSSLSVLNLSGFPLAATGVVGIIGEANGGQPGVLDILSREGIQSAKARYKSGNIADALGPLVAPSNDPRIPNGASMIVVWKTNHSTQSTANFQNSTPANILGVTSKNYGVDENSNALTVSAGTILDAQALIVGTVAGTYNVTSGQTLTMKINGVVFTFTTTTTNAAATAAAMITELNTGARWAPSLPILAAPNPLGTGIQITLLAANGALDYGYISITGGVLATTFGMAGTNRGIKGSRFITTTKGSTAETSPELGGLGLMSLLYIGAGTQATASIQTAAGVKSLTTTITGGPGGEQLNIALTDASGNSILTLQQLVNLINATPLVYTATIIDQNTGRPASDMDAYLNINCIVSAVQFNADLLAAINWSTTYSQYMQLALSAANTTPAMYSLIATPLFMTGGAVGTSANSDFQAGLNAFQTMRINSIVPLISQNAGTLTIDSINALVSGHCTTMWSTTGRSERQCFLSKNAAKASIASAARALNSPYVQLFAQQVQTLDHSGNLVWFDPWMQALIAAGMRQGSDTGTPLTFKTLNVTSIRVQDGSWDPKIDYAYMIQNGVTISEPLDTGGFRWTVDNTTYSTDPSFVYNRGSVVDVAGFITYDLRQNLELTFIGNKARTGTSSSIKNFIQARMSLYLDDDLTVGDDLNKGLGYKDLNVTVQGNTALVSMTITPVQGIDFILPSIYLADIKQSAA